MPPQERIFRDMKALSDLRFRFLEQCRPADYVSDVATWLQLPAPREKVISSHYLIESFSPEKIQSALQLLDIRRALVVITAKTMPPGMGERDQTEPVFGTKYRLEKMSEDFLKMVRPPS